MSTREFQEEMNALISEIAILKTKAGDEEMKTAILSIVQKTRTALKVAYEKQELVEAQ